MQNNQTISKREIKETIASLKQTGVVVECTKNKPFSKTLSVYKNNQKEPCFSINFWLFVVSFGVMYAGYNLDYNGTEYKIKPNQKTYNIACRLFDVCECMADGDLKRANRKMFPYVVQSKCRMFFDKIAHQR